MFKIDQHIEFLLLKNDCVVIPGFGGFVSHYQPARLDETDRTMLPPTKTIGFNPQLKLNDSLLIQSYAETYDLSYPEAQREVENEVESLNETLHSTGSFTFHSVGTLRINQSGNIEFEPFEAGILVPSLYALPTIDTTDSNAFISISKEVSNLFPFNNTQDSVDLSEYEDEEKSLKIPFSVLKHAAAACVAILCVFSFIYLNQTDSNICMSGIDFHFSELLNLDKKTEVSQPTKAKHVKHVTYYVQHEKQAEGEEVAATEETANFESTVSTVEPVKEEGHVIVLAARVKKQNAEIYVNNLKDSGIEDARIIGEGKSLKVVCGKYATEAEARSAMQALAVSHNLKDLWILNLK